MSDIFERLKNYAKEQFGYDIKLESSLSGDTFETIFGTSFRELNEEKLFLDEESCTISLYKNTQIKFNISDECIYEEFDMENEMTMAA